MFPSKAAIGFYSHGCSGVLHLPPSYSAIAVVETPDFHRLQQILTQALETEAILQRTDEHGQRYQVDLEIRGVEEEQQEIVRTGWIVKPGSDAARLVTLYVRKRQ